MKIEDFIYPQDHPWRMLEGIPHAIEKEQTMRWMLERCFEANDIDTVVRTNYTHPGLVEEGLLEEVGFQLYKLTRRGKGILYSYYGKE